MSKSVSPQTKLLLLEAGKMLENSCGMGQGKNKIIMLCGTAGQSLCGFMRPLPRDNLEEARQVITCN